MADRLLAALDTWSTRTIYNGDDHLVFAHPQTGNALDGSKLLAALREHSEVFEADLDLDQTARRERP
jgi:hypothetical protein